MELIFGVWCERKRMEILKLGLPEYFRSWIASGGSNAARLGELGGNLLPLFPIKRLKGAVLRVSDPPDDVFQLFLVKKIVFVKKIQAEVLP